MVLILMLHAIWVTTGVDEYPQGTLVDLANLDYSTMNMVILSSKSGVKSHRTAGRFYGCVFSCSDLTHTHTPFFFHRAVRQCILARGNDVEFEDDTA